MVSVVDELDRVVGEADLLLDQVRLVVALLHDVAHHRGVGEGDHEIVARLALDGAPRREHHLVHRRVVEERLLQVRRGHVVVFGEHDHVERHPAPAREAVRVVRRLHRELHAVDLDLLLVAVALARARDVGDLEEAVDLYLRSVFTWHARVSPSKEMNNQDFTDGNSETSRSEALIPSSW